MSNSMCQFCFSKEISVQRIMLWPSDTHCSLIRMYFPKFSLALCVFIFHGLLGLTHKKYLYTCHMPWTHGINYTMWIQTHILFPFISILSANFGFINNDRQLSMKEASVRNVWSTAPPENEILQNGQKRSKENRLWSQGNSVIWSQSSELLRVWETFIWHSFADQCLKHDPQIIPKAINELRTWNGHGIEQEWRLPDLFLTAHTPVSPRRKWKH